VRDTVARAAIARTRDGCLAEAARRKLEVEAIDAFQREAGSTTRWEATLQVRRRGRLVAQGCTMDLPAGRAVLREPGR
jgi:hypothetical protein